MTKFNFQIYNLNKDSNLEPYSNIQLAVKYKKLYWDIYLEFTHELENYNNLDVDSILQPCLQMITSKHDEPYKYDNHLILIRYSCFFIRFCPSSNKYVFFPIIDYDGMLYDTSYLVTGV